MPGQPFAIPGEDPEEEQFAMPEQQLAMPEQQLAMPEQPEPEPEEEQFAMPEQPAEGTPPPSRSLLGPPQTPVKPPRDVPGGELHNGANGARRRLVFVPPVPAGVKKVCKPKGSGARGGRGGGPGRPGRGGRGGGGTSSIRLIR